MRYSIEYQQEWFLKIVITERGNQMNETVNEVPHGRNPIITILKENNLHSIADSNIYESDLIIFVNVDSFVIYKQRLSKWKTKVPHNLVKLPDLLKLYSIWYD